MEKEFGKLSSQEFRRLFALVHQGSQDKEEFEKELKEDPEYFSKFIDAVGLWSHFYELTYNNLLVAFFIATGLIDQVLALISSDDPNAAALEWAESDPESPLEVESLPEDERKVVFGLFVTMIRNLTAMQLFHVPINDLLEKVRSSDDDEALFNAIYVDRHVLNSPTAMIRIARAEISEDNDFFDLLTQAINRSRPRRPEEDYDILRVMLTALDQAAGLDNLSYESMHQLLVDDLEIYPVDLKDSFSGLKKLIQRRQKAIGT